MRNSARNSLLISGIAVVLSLLIMITAIRLVATADTADATPLETVIGNSDCAIGNRYGMLYSITGEAIVTERDGKITAKSGFTNIVGSEAGGMIYQCRPILLSNKYQSNRLQREGNSIITTLHAAGQEKAVQLLSVYDTEKTEASITVMLRDGAVLVAAGNNSYAAAVFEEAVLPKDFYVDYSVADKEKGSCFKPVVYRMLLENRHRLPDELAITGDSFEDVSWVSVNGTTVHNWDWDYPEYYETNENGLYVRHCSLSELLQSSSNTAPLRCARAIGFRESFGQLKELFALDRPLITEINEVSGISVTNERLPWLFFGQDAHLSPLRMCQLYNHLVSGRFYSPYYTAAILQPDGKLVYKASPMEKTQYRMDVNVKKDVLNNALEDTFESYLTDELKSRYSEELLSSRRLLAKSGTAENANGTENRTLMLTVLNETRTDVVCSCCISVNNTPVGSISNAALVDKLLEVLKVMEII